MNQTTNFKIQRMVNGQLKDFDKITKQEWAESFKRAAKSKARQEFRNFLNR